jgi:SAM-dependent methyltransferase
MQIARDGDLPRSSDFEQIGKMLPLEDARLLELGCGAAFTTRRLAESFPLREIVAMEVDRIQHERNLLIPDLPNVRFVYGGAQAIDLPDASVDAVIMLKSLHHVPVDEMDRAFEEIERVLRPGGLVYISEPVYAGDFNDILRLFNDERQVREAAFEAIRRAVASGRFTLERELHFYATTRFEGFEEFESRILGATHSTFELDDALYAQVKERFLPHVAADGIAEFLTPLRVDLLRRSA